MKKKITIFVLLGVAACFSSLVYGAKTTTVSVPETKKTEEMSREEFMKLPVEERRARLQEYANRKYGGVVTKKDSAKGWVKFINSQKKVPIAELERPIKEISRAARVQWKIIEGEVVTVETAKAMKSQYDANVAIYVVDNKAYPALLIVPEEGWAIVNVHVLSLDNPSATKLASRLRKECSRAYAYVCGAANISRTGVVMGPVAGVSDLDMIPGDLLPRDVLLKFKEQLKLFGVEQIVQASYRKACEQGWAPPPSNDFQRAIWEEVNAIPDKPIKIKK